jgi:hypothetical protein
MFAFEKRDVKGVALNTHEGLRPSTLQAFEKACAKLLRNFATGRYIPIL